MKNYCTYCQTEVELEMIQKSETYPVRGKDITIDAKVHICPKCKNEIWDLKTDDANLLQAYNLYRKQKNLLFPHEIRAIREQYGLTQVGFAKVLGFGEKTISRYENGSLQDEAQNNLILLVRDPRNFMELFTKNRNNLSEDEVKQVESRIRFSTSGQSSIIYRTSREVTGYDYKLLTIVTTSGSNALALH